MVKPFNIKVKNKQELFLAYLKAINWTLPEQLTDSELEVLSYLVYYNNFYAAEIKSDEIRYDLLFSSSTKKKIREEFDIDAQKFETYLNKLRKKGIITNNALSNKVVITMEDKLEIRFTMALKQEPIAPKDDKPSFDAFVDEAIEVPELKAVTFIDDDDLDIL
jgi:predicted transcriptional regulator